MEDNDNDYNPTWIEFVISERAVMFALIFVIVALVVLIVQNINSVWNCCKCQPCECDCENDTTTTPPPVNPVPPNEPPTNPNPPPVQPNPPQPDPSPPNPPITNPPITNPPITNPPIPEEEEELPPQPASAELDMFHKFFKDTLALQFNQKAEKIVNPTRSFNNTTVFDNLQPWTSTADFGTMCHTMIGYCVRYNTPTDDLHKSAALAQNLTMGLRLLGRNLPDVPPHQNAPWGPIADWYHFTITMPEVFMNVTAVLCDTEHFNACAQLTIRYLGLYLPTATTSMGWVRTAGNAMRMGVPYVYGQMLRLVQLNVINQEPSVQDVLLIIKFPLVDEGNGLARDYIYIDHIDVRAYGYLINSFFTFNYYIYYFGENVLNKKGLDQSIMRVASPEGMVNPAVMSRNGTMFSNVIGFFVDYPLAVHVSDYSKVLTKLSEKYYGCVVGTTTRLAYYEADPTNNTHAPLWAMNRRLWNRNKPVINYTRNSVLFESGVLCLTPNGVLRVPSTTTSTQSFRPAVGETAIVNTSNCGAMLSRSRFAQLEEMEFVSCTLYYNEGMYQLFYDMGVREGALGTSNGRIVVLARDTSIVTPDPSFAQQRETNGNNSDGTVYNGVVCYRVPITGMNVPSLTTRVQNNTVEIVEQVLGNVALHSKTAVASYKLNVEGDTDNLRVFLLNTNVISVTVSNVKVLFMYPLVALQENMQLSVSFVNETTTMSEHTLDDIKAFMQIVDTSTLINGQTSNGQYTITSGFQFLFNLTD
nr:odv-e66 [Cnaphalocrocis medinalis granulovirus]